jgi:hypothetical protein
MEIYISIDGVLRNTIQKFNYHYKDFYLDRDEVITPISIGENGEEEETSPPEPFEYGIDGIVKNDNLRNSYRFQSIEEFQNFLYIDFAIEIFGHAGISYPNAISDLNNLIREYKNHNITLVDIDCLGRAKPSSLFFLSRNGTLANNIKFILSEDVHESWKNCDVWITDSKDIIDRCPENKIAIKFKTDYNDFFDYYNEINNLKNKDKLWQIFSEKSIT